MPSNDKPVDFAEGQNFVFSKNSITSSCLTFWPQDVTNSYHELSWTLILFSVASACGDKRMDRRSPMLYALARIMWQ